MADEPTTPVPPVPEAGVPTPPEPQAAVTPPPPSGPQAGVPWAGQPPPAAKRNPVVRVVGHRATGWFVAALMVGVITGLSVALANTSSSPVRVFYPGARTVQPPTFQVPAFQVPIGGSGSAQRPVRVFAGGTIGRVDSVGASSFTMTTVDGSKVTVDEESSTSYIGLGGAASKNAIRQGVAVAVFGQTSGSTLKASRILVLRMAFGGIFFP
jgi:hypothetical protein